MESALKEKVVLIVDDYEVNTKLLSFFIEEAGGIPLVASNGKKSLSIVQNQHVDMILMDKNMPEMDGIAATKAIRVLDKGKEIVIVGITGYEEETEIDECIKAGMDMAIVKLKVTLAKLIELGEMFFGNGKNKNIQNVKVADSTHNSNQSNIEKTNDNMIFDYDRALNEFENDKDLLQSIIKEFNAVIRKQFITIRQALNVSDFVSIQREAHGMKGGAANLRAMPLSEAAKSVELACKQNATQEDISELIGKLENAIDTFENYCNQIYKQKFY